MELLGRDLEYYLKKSKTFTLQKVLQIGLLMIDLLEEIHNKYLF